MGKKKATDNKKPEVVITVIKAKMFEDKVKGIEIKSSVQDGDE